jgi:hypothetical protein
MPAENIPDWMENWNKNTDNCKDSFILNSSPLKE